MKTSLKRLQTKDSLELVGLLYEPDVATDTVLVHVHGMAGNFYENRFLDSVAEVLTSSDVAFFAFNNRGCELVKDLIRTEDGKRKIVRIGNAYEIFEDSAIDIAAAIDFVSDAGFSKIHLSGHSLGSPKVAHYAAESNDERIASVLLLSPSDMVGLIQADLEHARNIAEAKKMLEEGRGHDLLPFPVLWDDSALSARTYVSLSDPSGKVAVFNFHDPKDGLPVLSRIHVPLYAVMGTQDDALVVPVEETMERIRTAATGSPKMETRILGDADHGYNGYEQELASAMRGWIQSIST